MVRLFTSRGGSRAARGRQTLRVVLALICILLVMVAGGAQLMHQHAGGEAQNQHCSLCVVAHLSVTVTPLTVAMVQVAPVRFVVPAVLRTRPARPVAFHLYVRPPPALTV